MMSHANRSTVIKENNNPNLKTFFCHINAEINMSIAKTLKNSVYVSGQSGYFKKFLEYISGILGV